MDFCVETTSAKLWNWLKKDFCAVAADKSGLQLIQSLVKNDVENIPP